MDTDLVETREGAGLVTWETLSSTYFGLFFDRMKVFDHFTYLEILWVCMSETIGVTLVNIMKIFYFGVFN